MSSFKLIQILIRLIPTISLLLSTLTPAKLDAVSEKHNAPVSVEKVISSESKTSLQPQTSEVLAKISVSHLIIMSCGIVLLGLIGTLGILGYWNWSGQYPVYSLADVRLVILALVSLVKGP